MSSVHQPDTEPPASASPGQLLSRAASPPTCVYSHPCCQPALVVVADGSGRDPVFQPSRQIGYGKSQPIQITNNLYLSTLYKDNSTRRQALSNKCVSRLVTRNEQSLLSKTYNNFCPLSSFYKIFEFLP